MLRTNHMQFNSIKLNPLFILIAFCLTFASSDSVAQETKGETLSGFVESVDGKKITVNHRRKSRTFTLHDKAKINYVSFLKAKEEIKPGFFIRAGVDSNGQCNQLWVTLPIPKENLKPSAQVATAKLIRSDSVWKTSTPPESGEPPTMPEVKGKKERPGQSMLLEHSIRDPPSTTIKNYATSS